MNAARGQNPQRAVLNEACLRSRLPSQRKNLDSPTLISPCVGVICTWMAAGKEKKRELVSGLQREEWWQRSKAQQGKAHNQIAFPAQRNNHFSCIPPMNELRDDEPLVTIVQHLHVQLGDEARFFYQANVLVVSGCAGQGPIVGRRHWKQCNQPCILWPCHRVAMVWVLLSWYSPTFSFNRILSTFIPKSPPFQHFHGDQSSLFLPDCLVW